jgi:hypothetical protein
MNVPMSARRNLCKTQLQGFQSATTLPKSSLHEPHAPHANAIDDRLDTLSASTPAPSAPNRHPSSSTAATVFRQKSVLAWAFPHPLAKGTKRTHQPKLPRPNRPSRDKVLHDEHVRDDALIVSKREASERGEHGAAERIRVCAQPCQSLWPVRVCVGVVFAVGVHGEGAVAEI